MSRKLTSKQLAQREAAAATHGAHSEAQIRPLARTQTRAFLRRNGLRGSDLDGVQRAYLDGWARAQSKIVLIDKHLAEHGLIRADGELQAVMKSYVSLVNTARLNMAKLEESLHNRQDNDPQAALNAYLEAKYTEEPDDGDE
jgi:hypothetical protein